MHLPEALYSATQVRELDRIAITDHGIPGHVLMQRAGTAAFLLLRMHFPRVRRIVVVCGRGNNGGDGFVLARLAHEAGMLAHVMSVGETSSAKGDAAAARQGCETAGVTIRNFDASLLAENDLVVDALLGTGLEREVEGAWRAAIEAINHSSIPVLALDIPSGLHADTGHVMGAAVRARATISFIGLKAGLFTGAGREQAGEIFFDDLDVPSDIYAKLIPFAHRLTEKSLQGMLPKRPRHAHKGNAGHVLVIGGDKGMPGAARLAGEAAYRAGAGLVTLATHPEHAALVNVARPELMVHGVASAEALRPLVKRADVIVLGPGLGQGEWGRALLSAAYETGLPMVVDADGLNCLAADPLMRDNWILTPHPGEAARLLGMTVEEVQADRFTAAHEITASFGGVCVLKGSGTLVASLYDGLVEVCDRGNPGMASGGMGDVLTGVLAALIAQGMDIKKAARLGVWVHAMAGDEAAAAGGEIGLLASDLLSYIRAHLSRLADHVGY